MLEEREQEDNQSTTHEAGQVWLPTEVGALDNESDGDNGYQREWLPRGRRHHSRVMGMYRKKRFGLEMMVENMLTTQNTILMRMESDMASLIKMLALEYPWLVIPRWLRP